MFSPWCVMSVAVLGLAQWSVVTCWCAACNLRCCATVCGVVLSMVVRDLLSVVVRAVPCGGALWPVVICGPMGIYTATVNADVILPTPLPLTTVIPNTATDDTPR